MDTGVINSQNLSSELDLPLLAELCAEAAEKWKSIGIQLGVPYHELSCIQDNNCGGSQMIQNCLHDMFNWWLNNGRDITPRKLAQALHIVNAHCLEIKVKKRFGLSCELCNYDHRLAELDLSDHVQRYCHDTKKRYIQQSVLPELDWPPSLGGHYISLAFIKQGRTLRDFKYSDVIEVQEDYARGDYDKILQRKIAIELEKIFDPALCEGGDDFPLKMLIDGAPGVGKTTLSREVSQKWTKGELLQEYWLVLLLHLRERSISKAQLIDNFFYHDDQMVQNAIVTRVKETSGKGVLIIFDGFDELSVTERCEQSLVLDIIKGKLLSQCAVVVTSRPYASRPVQELQSINRHIEVLGFTNKQIKSCIKQRIKDEAKAAELCAELEDRLDVASICQIPLNCSIVLYVYEQEDYTLPATLTKLYELFILHSLRRYTTRTQNISAARTLHDIGILPRPISDHFNILSKLAYDGLKEDKLVFAQEDLELAFSQIFTGDKFLTLDLMTSAKSYSSRGTHDTYAFLHLIIQEYLGAFWASKYLSESEKLDFLKENLKNERFYMVLWFFAGITKLNILNVHSIFNKDVWEYKNRVHTCHLLHESDSKSHSLCKYVAENCISDKCINLTGYYSSYQKEYTYILRYSKFDRLMIANFLAHSNCQWNSLTLNLDDVEMFHQVFNGLKSYDMAIRQVTIEVHGHNITNFHEGIASLLDKIPHFDNVQVSIKLAHLTTSASQVAESNFKNVLKMIKAIKSIYIDIMPNYKLNKPVSMSLSHFFHGLVEGIASSSLVSSLELQCSHQYIFEDLLSLFIKWNSNLKLVTLVARIHYFLFYHSDKTRCHEFCNLLSRFLTMNTSLRKITIIVPFDATHLMSCIDTIQSGLDQNVTLEQLTINNKFIFQRNEHTSKLEFVKDDELHSLLSN